MPGVLLAIGSSKLNMNLPKDLIEMSRHKTVFDHGLGIAA